MGDAEWVARHTTESTMVGRAGIGNGKNRTIRPNFDIICGKEQQIKYQMWFHGFYMQNSSNLLWVVLISV